MVGTPVDFRREACTWRRWYKEGTLRAPPSRSIQRNTFISELDIRILGRLSRVSRRNIYYRKESMFNHPLRIKEFTTPHLWFIRWPRVVNLGFTSILRIFSEYIHIRCIQVYPKYDIHKNDAMEYTDVHSVATQIGYHLVPAHSTVIHHHLGLLLGGNLRHAKDQN